MTMLVHLTPEKNVKRILHSGITRGESGVYCLPVMQNYHLSHQWLRELRRTHQRHIMGIYFRIPDDEMVWFGHYGTEHQHISVGEAHRQLLSVDDPRGYELIIMRTIQPKEIHKVREVSQVVGWRYSPNVRKYTRCDCPVCISRGEFNANRKRELRREPQPTYDEMMAELHAQKLIVQEKGITEEIQYEIMSLLGRLRYQNVRIAADLEFLLHYPSRDILEQLDWVLEAYNTKEGGALRKKVHALLATMPKSEEKALA